MSEVITLIPSAKRLMESLRDIGYDATTAVADLIDNSIAANATEVAIDLVFEGVNSWVRVADNGTGMSEPILEEALRFGSRREYSANELGKFGLGLKTASLSQCRRLTVATRQAGSSDIEIRQWDMGHVEETDSWEALRLDSAACRPEWISPLERAPGTVVVWDQLDRMVSFKLPDGKAAHSALGRLCREIEEHVSMVFHRFLAGEARRRLPLTIRINSNTVKPWDPFARSEPLTQAFSSQTLRLRHGEQSHSVVIIPYVLPNETNFSSPAARDRAAGPNKWNHQQGFYIYRNDRMIQSGGWNRLRTPDEHTKLARIAIDFTSAADSAFGINVAKIRVLLPAGIRNELQAIASGVAQRADAAYRRNDAQVTPRRTDTGSRIDQSHRDSESTEHLGGRSSEVFGAGAKPSQHGDPTPTPPVGVSLADSVVRILMRELSDHPEALERVLRALGQEHADIRAAVVRIRAASA